MPGTVSSVVAMLYALGQEMERLTKELVQVKTTVMEVTEVLNTPEDQVLKKNSQALLEDELEVRPYAEYGSSYR